jgi:shikimate kinase
VNIYLVGYRCCGKTSLGRRLAERLGWMFADTDAKIVAQAGREIAAIVEENGWAYFRRLERECLSMVATKSKQVVATGGGIVLDHRNVHIMKDSGVVVWLRTSPAIIRQRMQHDAQTDGLRPALTSRSALDEIESVLQDRMPLYQKAGNIELNTDHDSVEYLADHLLTNLGSEIVPPRQRGREPH